MAFEDELARHAVSPELVLVDPELAQRARLQPPTGRVDEPTPATVVDARQVEEGNVRSGKAPEAAESRHPGAGATASAEQAVPSWSRRVLRSRIVLVLAFASLGLVALTIPSLHRQSPYSISTVARKQAVTADGKNSAGSRQSSPLSSTSARPQAHRREGQLRGRRGVARIARRQPARVFVWIPVPEASDYRVQFFKGGKKILEAHASRARLAVPPHWFYGGRRFSLSHGRYLRIVRPGLGSRGARRYGPAIVRSLLVVT